MFAVIETGGKQYLVESGQTLKVERLECDSGSEVVFEKVLLIANDEGTDVKIGTPYIEGASISAKIEEQGRERKLRVVKYKRKTRYKKVQGHRQHFSQVTLGTIA